MIDEKKLIPHIERMIRWSLVYGEEAFYSQHVVPKHCYWDGRINGLRAVLDRIKEQSATSDGEVGDGTN